MWWSIACVNLELDYVCPSHPAHSLQGRSIYDAPATPHEQQLNNNSKTTTQEGGCPWVSSGRSIDDALQQLKKVSLGLVLSSIKENFTSLMVDSVTSPGHCSPLGSLEVCPCLTSSADPVVSRLSTSAMCHKYTAINLQEFNRYSLPWAAR